MDEISLGLMIITANMIGAIAFLRSDLDDIGIVVNPAEIVALLPKGHAPTAEEASFLESADVRIANDGGVTVVGVAIDTDEYVLERAMGVGKKGCADRLARCLANMPHKQAVVLIAIEPLGQRTTCLERSLGTGLSLEARRRADNGAQWVYENILEVPGAAQAQSFSQEGCPDNRLTLKPPQQAQARPSTGAGGGRAAVDGSDANVYFY